MNICELNSEGCSLNAYEIGKYYSLENLKKTAAGVYVDGVPKEFTVSFNEKAFCNGFSMVFRESDSELPSFEGKLLYREKEFEISVYTAPDDIRAIFGDRTDDEWNDGVEINLQYLFGNVRAEFSWSAERNNTLNYVDVSLEK